MEDTNKLKDEVESAVSRAENLDALEAIRISELGKNGRITLLMKELGQLGPAERRLVGKKLNELNLSLKQIMVTHHHFDHSGGVLELQKAFNCPAYGPKGGHIKGITNPLNDNEHFNVFDQYFMAMASPGHTNDQLAYFCESEPNPILFSGDTLFAAGCGRLFEGTPTEMHNSLSRFSALPLNTLVYCGHEYTESNLNFAIEVEPNNVDIQNRLTEVKNLRDQNKVTLPSTIELELK